jgi:sugar-specific transcriptional regulator TrmB
MDLKSIISKMGMDPDALMEEYREVSGTLARIGLSEYESRGYIALVAMGQCSATDVADIAQIPRTSSYKVMRSLEEKGLATAKQGRPRSFAPVPPNEVVDNLTADLRSTFAKIEAVRDILSERGVPQLVYTIMGRDRVVDKIGEMLDRSESRFVISSPSIAEIRRRLGRKFASAISRGVHVTIITSPFVKVPRNVEVIRRKGLIATDAISDAKTALLAASGLSACGYTDNEALSAHLHDFLTMVSEASE